MGRTSAKNNGGYQEKGRGYQKFTSSDEIDSMFYWDSRVGLPPTMVGDPGASDPQRSRKHPRDSSIPRTAFAKGSSGRSKCSLGPQCTGIGDSLGAVWITIFALGLRSESRDGPGLFVIHYDDYELLSKDFWAGLCSPWASVGNRLFCGPLAKLCPRSTLRRCI